MKFKLVIYKGFEATKRNNRKWTKYCNKKINAHEILKECEGLYRELIE